MKCVDGVMRWIKMCFEGDDSILSFLNKNGLNVSKRLMDLFHERWTALGHRPKLFKRAPGDVAEFCGWLFKVNPDGLDARECAPDVLRNLINMVYSTNAAAVAAAQKGNHDAFMLAVTPGVVARLYSIAPKFPKLTQVLYQQFAPYVKRCKKDALTLDSLYRFELETEDIGLKEYRAGDSDLPDDRIERSIAKFDSIASRFELEMAKHTHILDASEAELAVGLGLTKSCHGFENLLGVLEGGFRPGAENEGFGEKVSECLTQQARAPHKAHVVVPATPPGLFHPSATSPPATGQTASAAASSSAQPQAPAPR